MKTAFTANVWGDSVHACSAYKIGSQLKEVDPTSRRILLTQSVQHSELRNVWEVRQFRTDIREANQWLIRAKVHMWSLQDVSVVIYLDVDVVLNMQPLDVARMWSFARRRLRYDNVIAPYSGRKCLNGGFNILRPNTMTYRLLKNETAFPPRASSPAYHCPARTTDQYYLNKVFPHFLGVPASFGYHTSKRRCLPKTNRIRILHFFGRFMPWDAHCRSCLQEGGFCSYHNATKCDSVWHFQKEYWARGDEGWCRSVTSSSSMKCLG